MQEILFDIGIFLLGVLLGRMGFRKNCVKPLVSGTLPFDFIKSFWSLSDDGIKQLKDAYTRWQKRQ